MPGNLLQGAVSQLFNFQDTALEDTAAAATANAQGAQALGSAGVSTAQANEANAQSAGLDYNIQGVRLQQQGDYNEAAAYGAAADIATNSATLAGVAGDIQEYQTTRAVNQTVGAQRASIAAGGLSNSGSALALARSSFQQGYLQNQMTRVQTLTREGGFLEEAAAARSEQTAAQTAGDIANTTVGAYQAEQVAQRAAAAGYTDQAAGYRAVAAGYATNANTYGLLSSQAQVSAVAMSNALSGYLRSGNVDQTDPENRIAEALLGGAGSPNATGATAPQGQGWSYNGGQLSYNGQAITGTGTGTSSTIAAQVGSPSWGLRPQAGLGGAGWMRNRGWGVH